MAITASMHPELGQVLYAGSDFPHLIWFCFSKESLDQTHLVQKQAGVQESSGPILAECNGPTTTFPFSYSVALFHRQPESYCAETSPQPLSYSVALFHRQPESYCAEPAQIQFGSGWLSFGQADLVQKQASVQEPPSPLLANTSKLILTGCRSALAFYWAVSSVTFLTKYKRLACIVTDGRWQMI